MGRVFTAAEDKPGAAPVIILSHSFWQNQLHGERNVLGRSIALSGTSYNIIAVMPPEFRFFFSAPEDFYVPIGPYASDSGFNNRTAHGSISVLGRLRPGVSEAAARSEMETIAARLALKYPATNGGHSVAIFNYLQAHFSEIRPVLWLLMAAVVVVLLVGCVNVSNLLLTRGAEREREYAIRSALGSSGYRIFQQSLGESLWLALAAGGLGVFIADISLPLVLRLGPQSIPRLNETTISMPVLAFAFGITLLVSLTCGVLPALAALHVAPEQALRSYSAASSSGRGKQLIRSSLLVIGVAVTLVLSVSTGLLLRSLRNTLVADPGFAPDHLLNLDIVLTGDKYKSADAERVFFASAASEVRGLPGVRDVGLVCSPPLAGECGDYFYTIPGRTDPGDPNLPDANFNYADTEYFKTAGIHLISGRGFLSTDTAHSVPVAVVNETFAKKWWPKGDAVGHVVRFGGRGEHGLLVQIVGVIGDVKQEGLDVAVEPEMYFPFTQREPQAMVLVVRTSGNPEGLATAAEAAVHKVDQEVPVRIHPMSYYFAQTLRQRKFLTLLLSIFAGLAIVLAALGIFGVAAYAVTSRRTEIAVRIALGAQPKTVKRWISVQMLKRVLLGCAIGITGSLFAVRMMRSLLYEVSPADPEVMAGACLLLIVVAALAIWLPARRAAGIDSMQILRSE
jgi:putative ABC transport system permease protein